MSNQEQLRNHLKREVASRKLPLREVGRLSGIDHATLSKIMNGKRKINLDHLNRLSQGLGISFKEFLSIPDNHANEDAELKENLKAVQKLVKATNPEMNDITLVQIHAEVEKYTKESMTPQGKRDISEKMKAKLHQSTATGSFVKNIQRMHHDFIAMNGSSKDIALMGGALLYFIVTTDLIPDYLLPVGLLDDALIVQAISQRMENKNVLI